jgi:membrane protein YqaA with SNARE-associated domain
MRQYFSYKARSDDFVFDLTSYMGLFLVAFAAATLLPLQSEAVLVGMLLSEHYTTALLLLVATAGNVLGSVVNWYLGRSIERFRHKRWFPISERNLDKAQNTYRRYGRGALLLSWLPIVGDPITMVAGVMREPLWSFLIIVTIAKGVRYFVLIALSGAL